MHTTLFLRQSDVHNVQIGKVPTCSPNHFSLSHEIIRQVEICINGFLNLIEIHNIFLNKKTSIKTRLIVVFQSLSLTRKIIDKINSINIITKPFSYLDITFHRTGNEEHFHRIQTHCLDQGVMSLERMEKSFVSNVKYTFGRYVWLLNRIKVS